MIDWDKNEAYAVNRKTSATVFKDGQVPVIARMVKELTPEELNGCKAEVESF